MESRVACVMVLLLVNFQLATPILDLGSETGHTERRLSMLNAPTLWGQGHNKI